jgi:Chalcone isomerase-like
MSAPHRRRLLSLVLGLAAAWPLSPALASDAPIEVAGVRYEPVLSLGGQNLRLNGAGIRYRAVFKVYTAGLYVGAKADTVEAVLAQPGPKRIHVVMLRDIDANDLGRLFTKGMQDNATREEFAKSLPGTMKVGAVFSAKKRLAPGETFSVDWVPGTGAVIRVNGKPMGDVIPEPEFYSSLLRIWLGRSPADPLLKDALLGKPLARPGSVEN